MGHTPSKKLKNNIRYFMLSKKTMSHTPQYGVISVMKHVRTQPWYANVLKLEDMLFNHSPGSRYPLTLGVHHLKMYSTMKPEYDKDQVMFENADAFGGWQRVFVNAPVRGTNDYNHEAYMCIYYPIVQELYWVGIRADEARFGGIVHEPMCFGSLIMKIERTKFLMNRWRIITPLVGKWAIFMKRLYTEITYRPGHQGALTTKEHFGQCASNY